MHAVGSIFSGATFVAALCLTLSSVTASANSARFDTLVRGGTVYNGLGGPGQRADVGITAGRIAAVGRLVDARATHIIDAQGLAVAPGFINMLSWADESLLLDGRGQSDLRQGVTLEIFGEGVSKGPLTAEMHADLLARSPQTPWPPPWQTLDQYLNALIKRGVAMNVASFVGASTLRAHALGRGADVADATALKRMQALAAQAMREGALGVSSALIYAPGAYANRAELVALAKVAAEFDGLYISHIRNEGNHIGRALDEFLDICRRAGVRGQIHHLKLSGRANWTRFAEVVAQIERARQSGLDVSANMYTYTAGATGLDAAMPPWVQAGGDAAWVARLRKPDVRERVIAEMRDPAPEWDNLMQAAGPAGMRFTGFKQPALHRYIGQTLQDIADSMGVSPEEAAIRLVIEDGSETEVIYFLMSEDNVASKVALPWMHFGSDARALSASGEFLLQSTHPRAYGNFARLLGRYVREQRVINLAEAVRRLSHLPAQTLRLKDRGALLPGMHADVVVFDPQQVSDQATWDEPHRYARGVHHVWVNGEAALLNGEPTGAMPGRVVRGPGRASRQ